MPDFNITGSDPANGLTPQQRQALMQQMGFGANGQPNLQSGRWQPQAQVAQNYGQQMPVAGMDLSPDTPAPDMPRAALGLPDGAGAAAKPGPGPGDPTAAARPAGPAGPPMQQPVTFNADGSVASGAHTMTVHNGAIPTNFTFNADGTSAIQNVSPQWFQANAGRLSPHEFETSLNAGMSPGQINMGDFMRWVNSPVGTQGGMQDPASRLQMLQGFLGMGAAGNANQGMANQTLQSNAQYMPGGLAWQQQGNNNALAGHTISNDRLTDNIIAGMAGNNVPRNDIRDMVQFIQGIRPATPPRPGMPMPGMPGAGGGAAPGQQPPGQQPPGQQPPGQQPPGQQPPGQPPIADALDLRSLANNAIMHHGGTQPRPNADAMMNPAQADASITDLVASLPAEALSPQNLPGTWQFLTQRIGPEAMQNWWGARLNGIGAPTVQNQAIHRLMNAANAHTPGVVGTGYITQNTSPTTAYLAALGRGGPFNPQNWFTGWNYLTGGGR